MRLNKKLLGKKFVFAGGIEDTFVPHGKPGYRPLDEYELTQHYGQWRGDLERAKTLGITMIRWGVPWYRVGPERGHFDWSFTDEVIPLMVDELGIQPIIDLVHYGTPDWMEGSFSNPDYPSYVSEYAAAFASRYKRLVKYYTPLNEPTVNADFAGRRAEWPPYLDGDEGYLRVLLPIARGIQMTSAAISKERPDAVFVAVEAMHLSRALEPKAKSAARLAFFQDMLCFDLASGRVNSRHPLWRWLMANGASKNMLTALRNNAVKQDVLGVNFYPWSGQVFDLDVEGEPVIVGNAVTGSQFADVMRQVYAYAQTPLMVTETSSPGDIKTRRRWMSDTLNAVATVRREKVPVLGYTWFPLLTMIGWEYRTSTKPIEEHLLHLGLWDCHFDGNGTFVRVETPLVADYKRRVRAGIQATLRSR